MNRTQRVLMLAAALALAGCGGGGGSSGAADPAPPVNQRPTAAFTLSASTGFAPLTVTLDAGASSDVDGSIDSYQWDFGDGSAAASGAQVTHTFENPGRYRVALEVTDDDLATGSTERTVDARGAQLSGSIQILSSTAVDRDVNDRLRSPASNNSMAEAQLLPVPVRLGGFVNLPGTPDREDANGDVGLGSLFATGDAADYYAVELDGSEAIVLKIGEPDADLDLHLLDDSGNLVDASVGDTATEALTAPGPGSYFVVVFPVDGPSNALGASNYVLSIGQGLGTAASATTLSADFLPGELIVRPEALDGAAAEAEIDAVGKRLALARRGRAGRTRLMDLGASAQARAAAAPLPEHGVMNPVQRTRYQTLLELKRLRRQPEVAAAGLNYRRYPYATPNDPFYESQWHYPIINLPAAWDISTGDTFSPGDQVQVIVAVIDTGILPAHPDLQGQLVPGYDFIRDPATAADGDGIDDDPTDVGDQELAGASSFHGTHVAGTVAAASDNGAGVAGVAWGARIMPIRALGVGGGSTFDVMQGIAWAAGLPNDSGTFPAQPADVINLSLGSTFFSQMEEDFIRDEVVCQDVAPAVDCPRVIVIASAGNENTATPSYPAAYDGVISVAATTISNGRAPYSNFGSDVDVAAPGGSNASDANGDGIGDGVISTLADDSDPNELLYGYATLTGTSMSAPHVAGVAALMKDVYPALTPAEFEGALSAGLLTDDLGTPGRDDQFGHGLINAQKAVLWALDQAGGAGTPLPPILSASVSTLDFGTFSTGLELNVRNVGTGSIDATPTFPGGQPGWLGITPSTGTAVTAGQSVTYGLTVDRSGLADGDYQATLLLDALDPLVSDLPVTIRMRVASAVPDADAGLHYVILVDTEGETALPAVILTVANGVYDFTIRDVPPGSYRLFAGSDMDDDSFLCDGGEACGSYRTFDLPETLTVDAAEQEFVTGLDFVSEFRAVFSASGAAAADTDGPLPAEGFRYRKDESP